MSKEHHNPKCLLAPLRAVAWPGLNPVLTAQQPNINGWYCKPGPCCLTRLLLYLHVPLLLYLRPLATAFWFLLLSSV